MSAFDYSKYEGAGTDSVDQRSLGMPMINIVQKGSPQFDESHRNHKDKRIEGCKPGDLVFNPTNALLKRPLEIVITGATTVYTEWKPKTKGGGLVATHGVAICGHKDYRRGQPGTPTEYKEWLGENELVYTMYFMVMFKSGEKQENGILSFTSKQLKKARLVNKQIMSAKIPGTENLAPIFASTWALTTVPESNEKGGWFGYDITHKGVMAQDNPLLPVAAERYAQVKAMLPAPKAALLPVTASEVQVVQSGPSDADEKFFG